MSRARPANGSGVSVTLEPKEKDDVVDELMLESPHLRDLQTALKKTSQTWRTIPPPVIGGNSLETARSRSAYAEAHRRAAKTQRELQLRFDDEIARTLDRRRYRQTMDRREAALRAGREKRAGQEFDNRVLNNRANWDRYQKHGTSLASLDSARRDAMLGRGSEVLRRLGILTDAIKTRGDVAGLGKQISQLSSLIGADPSKWTVEGIEALEKRAELYRGWMNEKIDTANNFNKAYQDRGFNEYKGKIDPYGVLSDEQVRSVQGREFQEKLGSALDPNQHYDNAMAKLGELGIDVKALAKAGINANPALRDAYTKAMREGDSGAAAAVLNYAAVGAARAYTEATKGGKKIDPASPYAAMGDILKQPTPPGLVQTQRVEWTTPTPDAQAENWNEQGGQETMEAIETEEQRRANEAENAPDAQAENWNEQGGQETMEAIETEEQRRANEAENARAEEATRPPTESKVVDAPAAPQTPPPDSSDPAHEAMESESSRAIEEAMRPPAPEQEVVPEDDTTYAAAPDAMPQERLDAAGQPARGQNSSLSVIVPEPEPEIEVVDPAPNPLEPKNPRRK